MGSLAAGRGLARTFATIVLIAGVTQVHARIPHPTREERGDGLEIALRPEHLETLQHRRLRGL